MPGIIQEPSQVAEPALFKQKFSHFAVDQFLLGHETVVMSVWDHYDLCMRKSVLKFGNQGFEKWFCDVSLKLIECSYLLLGVDVGKFWFFPRIKTEDWYLRFDSFRRILFDEIFNHHVFNGSGHLIDVDPIFIHFYAMGKLF